jgi:WD40 repeat protein/tRNA A-37 threonylcarbamoyl transferase component Bud32
MQPAPSIPTAVDPVPAKDSTFRRMIDDLLNSAYLLFENSNEHFPHLLHELFTSYWGTIAARQSTALTKKEQQDLTYLQSYGNSLLQWDFITNRNIKNSENNNGENLQVTLADSEDSDPTALVLQIGIKKLGYSARAVLHSRYNQPFSFTDAVPDEFEKRWEKRLKYIGALRRIHEEVENDLSLDPLDESTLDLPALSTCVELGELLLRKGCIPSDSWKCEDQEIKSLILLIPKLLHSLPEEEMHVGRFKLIEKIGEGGYGIVYKGYDEKLRREVAVKMPRMSSEDNTEGKQLAIREARAAARLDHPGILPLLDIIDMPNQAILVSPFVQGASLSNWLRNRTTPVTDKVAAGWALEITNAMIHAHSRGVLHCDLKPGNILLEILGNDCPDEKIMPKIADFGLAKLTLAATTTVTGSGIGLGTPMYMAPEQTMGRDSLSVACDVYGVGGILYQLLANRTPFPASTMGELMREVLEKKPTSLKTYRKDLHPDLEAICMKCMEKEPGLRYLTMNDLNADLQRFLNGEPTIARPLGKFALGIRWCQKHALLISLLGIIFLSLTVSTIVFMFLLQKVTNQAEENLIQKELSDTAAKRQLRDRKLADRQFYASEIRSIQNAFKEGEITTVIDRLNGLTPFQLGGEELRSFEWHYWNRLCSQAHQKIATLEDFALKYSLDGKDHAAISLKKTNSISIVDTRTSNEILSISKAQEPTYSTNGATLAFVTSENVIQWIDAGTFKELGSLKNEEKILKLLFMDDNRLLALQSYNWKILDISSGKVLWEKPGEKKIVHLNICRCDKDHFATWGNDGRIQIWNIALKSKVDDFPCEGRLCQICASSTNGRKIAWVCYPSKMIVRDIEAKKNLVSKDLKDTFSFAMAWSPDDKQIALGGGEQTIDILNSENGELIERRTGHTLRNIRQIQWPKEGKLSSLGYQMAPQKSELLFWEGSRMASYSMIHNLENSALGFELDSEKKIALLFEESKSISLITIPEGRLINRVKLPDFSIAIAAHPLNPYFVMILDNREIWKVDHQGNASKLPIRCTSPPSGTLLISPSGEYLAIGLNTSEFDKAHTAMVQIYDIASGKLIATYSGELSPFNTLVNQPKSGSFIASQRTGAMVGLNWQDGTLIREYIKAPSEIILSAINPDFNLISTVKGLSKLQVMNFSTMTDSSEFRSFEVNRLRGLRWSEDSTRLIGWGMDGTIRLWDGITGQELLKLNAHQGEILRVIELPGGRKYLSLGKDKQLKLWDATPIK